VLQPLKCNITSPIFCSRQTTRSGVTSCLVGAAVIALVGCSASVGASANITHNPDGTPDKSSRAQRRDRALDRVPTLSGMAQQVIQSGQYPGLVIGVVLDGELIWWGGYGTARVGQDAPIDDRTVFRIASITKTVTGLALLRLRDEGKLALDDPLTRFVPEAAKLRPFTSDSAAITLRHLLTHTSGLPRLGGIDYVSRATKDMSEAELLDALDGLKSEFAPGADSSYSNLGMGLLGLVISRVTGSPFGRYIRQQILMPLRMPSTVWTPRRVPPDRLALGYARPNKGEVGWQRRHHWRLGAVAAMGGLYSNLRDMAAYVRFHMSAWPPRNGPEKGPVRRSSVRESHRVAGFGHPGRVMYGVAWGVGRLGSALMLTHTGSTWQYGAVVRMLPDRGLGIVAMANGPGSGALARLSRNALIDLEETLASGGLIRLPLRALKPIRLLIKKK
jgi:CubicO group peptidase (beta-lactamase class C family)